MKNHHDSRDATTSPSPRWANYLPTTQTKSRFVRDSEDRISHRVFKDRIHGSYSLSSVTCAAIETKPFQRLRRITQLGVCPFVFHEAHHSRYEHSLGVAHLAGVFAKTLLRQQMEKYSSEAIECFTLRLEVAGLLHDVGHGPGSHVWEHSVLPALGCKDWSHEKMSLQLVDYVFEEAKLEEEFQWTETDRSIIKALISGDKQNVFSTPFGEFPLFLFDIVNNSDSGFDVDKLDYLQRDSHYTKIPVEAPYNEFLSLAKVVGDKIVYPRSMASNLSKVYADRMNLHREVYSKETCKAIDLMVTDALSEVGDKMDLIIKSKNPAKFIDLKDKLICEFQKSCSSNSAGAQRAKAIFNRVYQGDYYTCCGETKFPSESMSTPIDKVTAQDIINCLPRGQTDVSVDDIHVVIVCIDQALKDDTSIIDTSSSGNDSDEYCAIEDMIKTCKKKWLRVYCKNAAHEDATKDAFAAWKNQNLPPMEIPTPSKQDCRRATPENDFN
eukprot:g2216.t1